MTPFQRQVLVEEFSRQEQEKQDELPDNQQQNTQNRQVSGGRRNQRHGSVNSKTEAIKESQEETERFVNESVIDNE